MTTHDLVIVGGGPRAISLIERLSARRPPHPLRVMMIDKVEIGAGATWRTDQTPHFLNNTYAAHTTIYPDESTPMAGPPTRGPDLMGWVGDVVAGVDQFRTAKHVGWRAPTRPDWVRHEAHGLNPWDYPTRRIQGVYYREQLEAILDRGHIHLDAVIGEVVALEGRDDVRWVHLRDGRVASAAHVVLAQGMIQAREDDQVRSFRRAAQQHGLTYVSPGMPSERDWSVLTPGADVLVAGLGANFFDVITLLTEGRGGRFRPRGNPFDVEYEPSGGEPRFFVGSRRGLPYRSKSFYGSLPPTYEAQLATDDWFKRLATIANQDFASQIWPVFQREFSVAHLATLATNRPEAVEGVGVLPRPAGWSDPATAPLPQSLLDDIAHCAPDGLATLVNQYVVDPRYHFDPTRLDRPDLREGESWQQWVTRWVWAERESITTPFLSPRASVNRAMARLRVRLGRVVRAGGVDPVSVHRDIQGWFEGISLALASGPPPERTARLLALVEAGIIHLLGEHSTFGLQQPGSTGAQREVVFCGQSPSSGNVYARHFAETRMSKGNVDVTDDPLILHLMRKHRARLHAKVSPSGKQVTTRTLDVTADTFALIDADGHPDPRVMVLGIPAGDVQPGSAIGATPGVPSPLLAGADLVAGLLIPADQTLDPLVGAR